MDWLKNKISTQSSSSTTSSISTADEAAAESNLKPQLDNISNSCYVCINPCDHIKYSDTIVSKIETGDLTDGLHTYGRHIVICIGESYNRWPETVEKSIPYVAAVNDYIKSIKSKLPYDIKITVTDVQTIDSNNQQAVTTNSVDSLATIYLYPDMQQFNAVSVDQVKTIINAIAIGKVADNYIKQLKQDNDNNTDNTTVYPVIDSNIHQTSISTHDILVCAHKLRDKRCGVMGVQLIESLQQTAKQLNLADKIRVLPTSHVGQHKYAANLILYPYGVWFGRITPCQSQSILQAYINNDTEQQRLLQPWKRFSVDLAW